MSTSSTPTPQPSIEEKILLATQEAEKAAAIFSPQVAALIGMGVAIEPVISGFAKLIIGLFHHHTGVHPQPATK